MGYYTKYKLTVKDLYNNTEYEKQITKELLDKFKFLYEDLETDEIKWYEHVKELTNFSSNYNNVLFTLTGIGEEHYFEGTKLTADIWIKYFYNGKTYTDKLNYNFPKFNSDKLK